MNEELLLKEHICCVEFIKADGSKRKMRCTLKSDVIVPYQKKTEQTKPHNEDVIAVWDIENNGWRSFRRDSVLSLVVES